MKRLLIIGWDGADWEILTDLVNRGCLPNVARLIEEGVRADLMSTMPYHSWTAWSSFLTGVGPGRHGVFDFVERDPSQPDRRVPLSSGSIKAPTFLERLSGAGLEVRAGNIPVTFPPIPVRGRMIAGVAVPPRSDFVYPKDWARELRERAEFPTNGMEWAGLSNNPAAVVDEALRLVERRTRSYEVLLEGEWSVGICVYLAPDRLQHPLGAHLLPSHPEHSRLADTPLAQEVRGVFSRLDSQIERLQAAAGPDATTILMSDHGFRPITRATNLDRVMQRQGLSSRSWSAGATTAVRRSRALRSLANTHAGRALKRRVARPSALDWSKTIAYCVTSGSVSLNLKGREARGVVDPADYERVREEVRQALLEFRDDETGARPVAHVYRREELYEGPFVGLAPDLLAEPAPLWDLTQRDFLTAAAEWPSAAHRRTGILVAAGPEIEHGDLGPRDITDMAGTALAFSGLEAPGLDGSIIEEIAGKTEGLRPGEDWTSSPRASMSEEEEEFVARHLRDLGYIE